MNAEFAGAATGVGAITYAIGAVAYAVLLVLLANRPKDLQGTLILIGIAMTLAWAGGSTAYYWGAPLSPRLIAALELLRVFAWIAFLTGMVHSGFAALGRIFGGAYLVPLAVLIIGSLFAAGAVVLGPGPVLSDAVNPNSIVGIALAVAGLFLTEILYRNTPADQRWQIKFLCLATGTVFAYDLFLYADAGLFGEVDPVLQQARGRCRRCRHRCWLLPPRAAGFGRPAYRCLAKWSSARQP